MNIDIFKEPMYENDPFYLTIKNFELTIGQINSIEHQDNYLHLKSIMFKTQNIHKLNFLMFKDRPSFRNYDKIKDLEGTIYTYAVKDRNDIDYDCAINLIKNMLSVNPTTKRCILRMANGFLDYYISNDSGKDVSCLSLIHYFEKSVTLIFRASDIKNELFTDLMTIYKFFIRPIYDDEIDISIFANCSQNVSDFKNFIKNVNNL